MLVTLDTSQLDKSRLKDDAEQNMKRMSTTDSDDGVFGVVHDPGVAPGVFGVPLDLSADGQLHYSEFLAAANGRHAAPSRGSHR